MPKTFNEVHKDLLKFPRDPNKYGTRKVKKIEPKFSPGIKTVNFKCIVEGEKKPYNAWVQFNKVDFFEDKKVGRWMAGQTGRSFNPISLNKNPVKLKCSCQDSRFTFEHEMFQAKALVGNWRRYENYPGAYRRNPKGVLGYCKHINEIIKLLKRKGLVR